MSLQRREFNIKNPFQSCERPFRYCTRKVLKKRFVCLNHLYYESWQKFKNFQRGCHFSIRPLNPRSILALNSKSGLDEFSRFVFSTSSEFEKSRKVLKFGHLIKRATGSSEQLLNALILICTTEKDDADADQMFEKYSNQEHWVHLYKSDEFYAI